VQVLLAFIGVTFIVQLVGWVNTGMQVMTFAVPNGYDPTDEDEKRERRFEMKLYKEMANKCHDFLMSCTDQQLVTGIALAGYIGQSKHACELSTYHFSIIVRLMLCCCISAMISMTSFVKFWDRKWQGAMRVLASIALLALTGSALWTTRLQKYPKSSHSDLLILAATCIESLEGGNTNLDSSDGLFIIYILTTMFWAIGVILDTVCLIIATLLKDDTKLSWRKSAQEREDTSKRGIIAILYVTSIYSFTVAVLIYLAVDISRLRKWFSSSGWLNEDNGNSENDLWSIGQVLPFVLFILPILGLISVIKKLYLGSRFRFLRGKNPTR
jgi:hypothetical protein